MASERKPRPPVPPKNKQRSSSDRSGYEESANDSFEYRNFQTLPDRGINRIEAKNSKAGVGLPPASKLAEENFGTLTRQAPPPEDSCTVLSLPPVEPQTFLEEDAQVFFTCSSLPSNSSHRGSSTSSDASDSGFKFFRQASAELLEDPEFRRYSDVAAVDSGAVAEKFPDYPQASSSVSLSSRIEPSPERMLGGSREKHFASDPDLLESSSTRGILRSDPDDETEKRKSVKGRGLRPSMLMLSKSLASLNSPDEKANKSASPEKKKVDIDKLNRFFGESKETATDLEANIYHLLISGNQLKDSSPGSSDGNARAKKSASTWFLSPKALESLPEKPLDAQFVQKARKSTADDLSTVKLKGALTEKGKQIMKSFKRRVVGVANMAEGLAPSDEAHGTFDIPIEECVMSPTKKFVPLLVEKCVKVIEEIGLQIEGIYRLSGNGSAVTELQEELDREPAEIDDESEKWTEVHVITNILKLYFRKLPDSLMTDELYESVIQLSGIGHREKRLLKLKVLLEKLPKVNFETFKFLSRHLHKVASFWNVNKMDAHNLAIMFGPTLVRSPKDQTLVMIKDMHHQTTIVETIIKHSDWLFGGWGEDRSVPTDEVPIDAGANSTSNLQLLESAETLVARQLRVVPVEEKSSFFSFQGPHRRSKRRHRDKSGKDESNETEQKTIVPDVDREIDLHRVKFPALPFKTTDSLHLEQEQFRKTLFDAKSRVKRSATERLDAKTLDIRHISNKLSDEKEAPLQESSRKSNPRKNSVEETEQNGAGRDSGVVEIKTYRAYDAEVRAATLTKPKPVEQPTLLRKYSSKPNLAPYGVDTGSLKRSPVGTLTKYSSPNLTLTERENPKSAYGSLYRQTNSVGYHPDVSQLPVDYSSENAYWENGSLKKTNIVVRGPLGRRYCVLSGTDPAVLLDGVPPTDKPLRVVEYLDKKRCAMTCVINVKLNVVREAGSHDVELRRIQYA